MIYARHPVSTVCFFFCPAPKCYQIVNSLFPLVHPSPGSVLFVQAEIITRLSRIMDHQLLEKYFKGLCTEAEQEQVETWMEQPGNEVLDAYLTANWKAANPERVTKVRRLNPARLAIAAAVTGLIAFAAYQWQGKNVAALVMAPKMDTLANDGEGVKLVSMPDGTKAWLNAHSFLTYDEHYNTASRQLWLTGEAYFEVARNEKAPFSVNAGGFVTTALGTSFNIISPTPGNNSVQISLVSGKAAVSIADTTISFGKIILLPGDRVTFKGHHDYRQSRFTAREAIDWKDGKLVFENTRLADAFAKLERRYGQPVVLMDRALAEKRLTASFPAQAPLKLVLDKLSFVQGIAFEHRGDTIFVCTAKHR